MNAYVITPDGERQPAAPRARGGELHPASFTEEELEDIVGGYAHRIQLTEEVVMIVDECGAENDKPFNREATELMKKALPDKQDFIVGSALVCLSVMVGED